MNTAGNFLEAVVRRGNFAYTAVCFCVKVGIIMFIMYQNGFDTSYVSDEDLQLWLGVKTIPGFLGKSLKRLGRDLEVNHG